jgi:MinD superfamily P-loop ATPase
MDEAEAAEDMASAGNENIRIAIASGKGGTGKTLVSTNLFFALQQHDYQVTLVDCDAEEPNDLLFFSGHQEKSCQVMQNIPVIDTSQCVYCGKCQEYCNYHAIFIIPPVRVIQVIEDLCHGCGACLFACEHGAISEKDVSLGTVDRYSISATASVIEARLRVGVFSPVSTIKAAVKEAGDEGVVLMDSPPGTSCPFIHAVSRADYVILVTEPTPFGLSDLKQSVETLKTMGKSYGVIINRAGLGNNEMYHYLEQEKISLLMEIPYDKSIASLYSKGEMVARHKPEWQIQLMTMFSTINEKYGNSSHQR